MPYPMQRNTITWPFKIYNPFGTPTMHYGDDEGNYQPITDAVYATRDMKIIGSFWDGGGGNMIIAQGAYDDYGDFITREAHLRIRSVSAGEYVKAGQLIGYQGNTGSSTTAKHLHHEIWLVPKNYKYSYADRMKYAVEPLSVARLGSDQVFVVTEKTYNKDAIPDSFFDGVEVKTVKGTLLVKNGAVSVRAVPSTKYVPLIQGYKGAQRTLGSIFGVKDYRIIATCENDGYTWAKIVTPRGAFWVAILEGYTEAVIESEIKQVGTPDSVDITKDQILVTYAQLRARDKASTDGAMLGYINKGYFNVDERTADGWCKVNKQYFIKEIENCSVFIPKATQLYDISITGVSQGDKDAVVKLANELELTYEVSEK